MKVKMNDPSIKNAVIEAVSMEALSDLEYIAGAHLDYIADSEDGRPPVSDHHDRATVLGSQVAEVISKVVPMDVFKIVQVHMSEEGTSVEIELLPDE